MNSISVHTQGELPNILRTFWSKVNVNIADGLDFQDSGDLYVRFTILQHAEFNYEIVVNNSSHMTKRGTCRLFIGPKYDEDGRKWKLSDQKTLMIEMDKFTVVCKYRCRSAYKIFCLS